MGKENAVFTDTTTLCVRVLNQCVRACIRDAQHAMMMRADVVNHSPRDMLHESKWRLRTNVQSYLPSVGSRIMRACLEHRTMIPIMRA